MHLFYTLRIWKIFVEVGFDSMQPNSMEHTFRTQFWIRLNIRCGCIYKEAAFCLQCAQLLTELAAHWDGQTESWPWRLTSKGHTFLAIMEIQEITDLQRQEC